MTCGIRLTFCAAIAAMAWHCGAVSAAITCEQLATIAYTTQKLRDQGTPLAAVLTEADKLQASNQFTAAEMEQIRTVVEIVQEHTFAW
jgi:carbonic anhydrase